MAEVLSDWSQSPANVPAGAFYLWVRVDDAWEFTRRLARDGGAIASPGDFYGVEGADHVRVAVVQPDEYIETVATRLRAHREA